MSKSLTYLFVFMLATAALHAQEIIDTAQFRAVYTFAYKTVPEQSDYVQGDRMHLDMSNKTTKFYSVKAEIRDSIMNEGLKKGLSPWELRELVKGYPQRGTTQIYYQLYDEKKTKVSTEYIAHGYTYEEPMEMPNWTLHEDTMTVLGYICKRATTHYRGRDWEVYYTSDIPLSRGPWKLWGLPGLIVRATDADHYFLFEMTNFERLSGGGMPIVYIHRRLGAKGGYTGEEYKKISKGTYSEYEKSFHDDVMTFTNFELGSEIRDTEGTPPPVIKEDYIPLEK